MAIRELGMLGMSVMVGFAAMGGTFHVKGTLSGTVDWTAGATYDEESAPTGAGDEISLHEGWISGVGYQAVAVSDADAASFALLKSVAHIALPYGTRLTVICGADETFPPSVTGNGTLVKMGQGELHLTSHTIDTSKNIYYDLQAHYDIREGALRLPVADDVKTRTHSYLNFTIAQGATLYPVLNGSTQCYALNGEGNVVSSRESGTEDNLMVNQKSSTNIFSGTISGRQSLTLAAPFTRLTNLASSFTGNMQIRNYSTFGTVLETPTIGAAGANSPLGSGNVLFSTGGARLLYTGTTGETTAKQFYILEGPAIIDAGAHGGLTFTGNWTPYSSNKSLIKVYLTGSNAVPCTVKGNVYTILDKDTQDQYYPYYFTKQGTGTWRFEQTKHRDLYYAPQGVFAVEQGTLEFNTISNAGTYCALGYATELHKREADTPSAASKVEYAWLLGGTDEAGRATEGRMLFTGALTSQVTNRPLALATAGAFGTTQARIRLCDVRTEGAGAKTLALEAPAGITNDLVDVAGSAEAPVGLVKRGAGMWRVSGAVSLGGPIAVEGGTLVIENRPTGSTYTWFRLTVKETAATCARYASYTRPDGVVTNFNSSDKYVNMAEFALFDADGNRINLGLKDAPSALDIAYGQTTVDGASNAVTYNKDDATTLCLFDNVKPTPSGEWCGGMRFYTTTQIRLDTPSTWVPIVFRLTNGTARAVSCDFVYPGNASNDVSAVRRFPTAMRLEAGNDGIHWEQVWEDDAIELPWGVLNSYSWVSNSDEWWAGYHTARKASAGKSFAFSQTGQQRAAPALASLPNLSVAAGATFRVESDAGASAPTVSGVTVDGAAGAGTVEGVAFAANGTIDVTGITDAQAVTLPLGFAGTDGAANLQNWSVTVDGEPPVKYSCTVSADGSQLTVARRGTIFVVR